MRPFLMFGLALVLVLLWSAGIPAQDKPEDILAQAVKVQGGKDKLTRFKASHSKAKGTLYSNGMSAEFTVETWFQRPQQMKTNLKLMSGNNSLTFTEIARGDKVSRILNGQEQDTSEKLRTALLEEVYVNQISTLVPLVTEKGYELTILPEIKVHDRPAVGIKVKAKGHKDVSLYFDKADGWLVKTVNPSFDEMANKELTQEKLFSDYKDFGGIKHATKLVAYRDGTKVIEGELTETEDLEQLDDKVFEP
jgi:hypothetical protein